ncbi:MAG: hypothetical protein QXZ07_06230 [Nitrososphaerales archaeon]
MNDLIHPNGYIDELEFKYNSKMERYTNISSNRRELSEIPNPTLRGEK